MKYQSKIENNTLRCEICPRMCHLKEGQVGYCNTRKNINSNIELIMFAKCASIALDPIEKKPLYHFLPASNILSFGTLGCNMGCLFCQNWNITKVKPNEYKYPLQKITPFEIVNIALQNNYKSIAFTYNDPAAFFEYALETAKLAKKSGIKTVAVSAGYINKEPLKEFLTYIDAINIDLKAFSEEFYKKYCNASLDTILDNLKYIKHNTNTHLEITTLLIEGLNDSDDILKKECSWILNNLGESTILHFSAFHPDYKLLNYPKTSLETLLKAYNIAKSEGLKYVYSGNILNKETSTTYCPKCNKAVIERYGFKVLNFNIINSNCKYCGAKIDGVF